MVQRIKDPQELEVHFILPAIRRDLTIALKEMGLDQKQIAKHLKITEPAVSQYLNHKRANNDVSFSSEIKEEIKKAAIRIQEGQHPLKETQSLLKAIIKNKVVCGMCHHHLSTSESCDACF